MSAKPTNLKINGQRLWDSLMEMAVIGGTAKGGCNRQTVTDLDRQGRDLFARWCREAGCTVGVDRMAVGAAVAAEGRDVFAARQQRPEPRRVVLELEPRLDRILHELPRLLDDAVQLHRLARLGRAARLDAFVRCARHTRRHASPLLSLCN